MASPFQPSKKPTPFTARSLIDQTRAAFSTLPDSRKTATRNNLKYAVEDAALSAFSVFFTQSPSFLDYQVRMQKTYGKNNAQSLFGVYQIPSMNQVRNILDPIPPQTVYPVFAEISEGLHQNGYLNPYRRTGNTLLIALDGTDFMANPVSHPIAAKLILLALTAGFAINARFRVIPALSKDNLEVMAGHIVAVTVLSVLFVIVGVSFRTGWLY